MPIYFAYNRPQEHRFLENHLYSKDPDKAFERELAKDGREDWSKKHSLI